MGAQKKKDISGVKDNFAAVAFSQCFPNRRHAFGAEILLEYRRTHTGRFPRTSVENSLYFKKKEAIGKISLLASIFLKKLVTCVFYEFHENSKH